MKASFIASGQPAILNTRIMERAVIHDHPFRWVETPEIFRRTVAAELGANFASDGLALFDSASGSGDKRYRLQSRTLADTGNRPRSSVPREAGRGSSLADVWLETLAVLSGATYRNMMSTLADVDLSGCDVEIRSCSYGAGCWMDPHTDRPEKLATHVIYLTPIWEPSWGGSLQLLHSPDPNHVAKRIIPVPNSGVLMVRSERSWHSVEPVRRGAPDRHSILVHFELRP